MFHCMKRLIFSNSRNTFYKHFYSIEVYKYLVVSILTKIQCKNGINNFGNNSKARLILVLFLWCFLKQCDHFNMGRRSVGRDLSLLEIAFNIGFIGTIENLVAMRRKLHLKNFPSRHFLKNSL